MKYVGKTNLGGSLIIKQDVLKKAESPLTKLKKVHSTIEDEEDDSDSYDKFRSIERYEKVKNKGVQVVRKTNSEIDRIEKQQKEILKELTFLCESKE